MPVENYWFIALSALFLLFLAATFFVACFVLTQALRRKFAKKGIKQIQSVNNRQPEDPLLSEVTLNDGSRVKLAEIQLVEKISDGRFGQVYRARVGEMFFAVKQFPEKEEDSWTNEMDLYNLKPLCKNDCIAKFLGGFQWDKKCWLLIKFYEKASLFDFLKSNTISLAEAVKMISTMLNGLAFLHEEIPSSSPDEKPTIVHRDLKSKNILVQDDLSTCITDFGLALRCDSKGISADQNHLQVGTRRYMSPEVLEGATEFTSFAFQQIDVYAAALVIWEVLSRTHIPEATDDEITPFMLPYEKEVGSNPSTIQIRDLVALQKYRPQIRPALLQNEVSTSITRTMREMWDHEPDGRITSSCARDRSRVWISETIT